MVSRVRPIVTTTMKKTRKRDFKRQPPKMFHGTSISEIVRISGLFQELNIKYLSEYSSAQVKPLGVTVNILRNFCYNTVLVFVLL
jgi:hypothetical protein